MDGNELLRHLKRIAKERGERLAQMKSRGKGSHITVYLGERRTILKDRKKEIGPGLLRKILDDLGVDIDEL